MRNFFELFKIMWQTKTLSFVFYLACEHCWIDYIKKKDLLIRELNIENSMCYVRAKRIRTLFIFYI